MIKFAYSTMLLLFVTVKLFAQDVISAAPIVLPPSGQTYQNGTGYNSHIISAVSVALNSGTGYGVILTSNSTTSAIIGINSSAPPSNPANDYTLNWIMTRTYDESGNEIGTSKQFFDNNGKATQTQTKNESTTHVLASQTIYDLQGRAVLSTLPAPTNNSAFAYKSNFVTYNNTAYSYLNFDGDPTNTSNPYAKLNNPDIVDNTTIGTLGWYYSNNNSFEPMVATTSYPYGRSEFYHDGTGAANRDAGIGESLRMGSLHETTSNSFPVQNELVNYLAIRNQFFPTATVGNSPASMAAEALQSVSTDQNGTSVLSVTDLSGKMSLMTGRADPGATPWLHVLNTVTLSNVQPLYAFQIATYGNSFGNPPGPGNGGLYIDNTLGFSITSLNTVNVYQSGSTTPIYTGPGNGYVYTPTITSFSYQVTSVYPFYISATNYYDQAEAQYTEPTGSSIQYFQLSIPSVVNITGGSNYTLYNMTKSTDITATYVSGTQLPVGYYKITALAPTTTNTVNNLTVSYTNAYSDISYNYYNQLGQLIASIAPNGVQALTAPNGLNANTVLTFTTTYQYDLQGRLISTTSPDGGTSNFVYRQDGKIRFSQNALQINTDAQKDVTFTEKFSYTNYDQFGRPVESGEYMIPNGTAAVFAGLQANTTLLEATGVAANVSGGTKLSQINTVFDLPATDPNNPKNLNLTGYVQDPGFLKGAISYTYNANSTTWYNYDDHGRVTWLVKQIAGLTGYKTVDYTYNDQGNVTVVDYQKGTASERFTHNYQYDNDGRLVNVTTSAGGGAPVQQAKYYYYLHGPLKRTELGNQIQGVDYVYTPQGWLKAINSPTGNPANDPMKDGVANGFAPDAFGMQLEYFPQDYSRGLSNVTPVATNTPNYFNGNVAGMSWWSNSTPATSAMYTYTYDKKYQYTGATWGTPGYTSNPGTFTPGSKFQESQIQYDPNGNITTLQRTGVNGGLPTDNFTYNYTPNTNQLATVANTGTTKNTNSTPYGTYTYDEIGRVKTIVTSEAAVTHQYSLQYDVTGKVTAIYNNSTMPAVLVESNAYDEGGNRISNTNYMGSQPITTYYVYDASGNVLAIYNQPGTSTPVAFEMPVYGSERLGTYLVSGASYRYELRDNVGSVRVVVNGTKNVATGNANIYNYTDYYPYGLVAQSGGTDYRYAYQGAYAENDKPTGYSDFQLRMYDSRIARWLSVDPKNVGNSPYSGMADDPVSKFDKDGGDPHQGVDADGNIVYDDHLKDGNIYLVNKGYTDKIDNLKQLIDNSTQLARNSVWIGTNQQLKDFISAQWLKSDGGFDNFLMLMPSANYKVGPPEQGGNSSFTTGTWTGLSDNFEMPTEDHRIQTFDIGNPQGKRSIMLEDVYNVRNALSHEKEHLLQALIQFHDHFHEPLKANHIVRELDAIRYQQSLPSYQKTSDNFKAGIELYKAKFTF